MPETAMPEPRSTAPSAATSASARELADRIRRLSPQPGVRNTAIDRLQVFRANSTSQRLPTIYEPAICLVAQGAKHALLGGEVYRYDAMNYLLVSAHLPVVGQILEATEVRPFLSAKLLLDLGELTELLADLPSAPARDEAPHGLLLASAQPPLQESMLRLFRLMDEPDSIPALVAGARREVLFRVLSGPLGTQLRALTQQDGRAQRIYRVMRHIRERYTESLRIEALADIAHMSPSTLHLHFKQVASMSPLQYIKQMRLHEARRRMLVDALDASEAAHQVGYESASQFSREYKRLFGAPPKLDIQQARHAV